MTIFLFLFGLAIFLYAMRNLEAGLRSSSGEGLKNWIVRSTNTHLSSAGCGVIVTAILQSSSMVSLIVLAFVSSGVIPLYNGIGVMLGANVGTTMTGWIVTIVGFKMDLQAMIVPLLGIGAVCQLSVIKNPRVTGFGKAVFAFGLLMFGLDIMKDSVTGLADAYDISALQNMPSWGYLLSGLLLAAFMQSSSAVMIVVLSMLSSNILQISDAAAIIIGADLGTTSTTVLGSIGESIIKRQLALAHVMFNLLVGSLAFFLLLPVFPSVLALLNISDPMFSLVAFHSTFNFLGLVLVLPLLHSYTGLVERLLPAKVDVRSDYFDVPVEVPDAALDSLYKALNHLRSDALSLHLSELEIRPEKVGFDIALASSNGTFEDRYEALKVFEGDFVRYAGKLQLGQLSEAQSHRVTSLMASARALVYASKTLQDIRADYALLHYAKDESLGTALHESHDAFLLGLFKQLNFLFFATHDQIYLAEQLDKINEENGIHFEQVNQLVVQHLSRASDASLQISTWFNLNHELHHYVRYMLSGLREMNT